MKYIMVTNFVGHWNQITHTTYTVRMLRNGMTEAQIRYGEEISTIFIKKNPDTHAIETCWRGRVKNFSRFTNNRGIDTIGFDVVTDQVIECPEEYRNYAEGWYYAEGREVVTPPSPEYDPPFFAELLNTREARKFEELTHKLLKIMGIHEVLPFPPEQQRGRSDGFFKIKKLSVIYDSTLETNWERPKEEQVNNYCARLHSGIINYQTQTINIPDYDKQVWIITRGTNRSVRKINEVDVREVNIDRLIEIYRCMSSAQVILLKG